MKGEGRWGGRERGGGEGGEVSMTFPGDNEEGLCMCV